MPFVIGMILSSFAGPPADIRVLLGSLMQLDAIGTVLGVLSIIPIGGQLFETAEVARRAVRAASRMPAERLPNLLRAINRLPIPAGARDEIINAFIGNELRALTDAGMTAAGKARLLDGATDFKALKRAIDGAAQREPNAPFMGSFREGEAFVRSGDILGTGQTFNFLPKGKGFAEPLTAGPRRWRIVDGWDPALQFAREAKVGFQCPRPGCDDKIVAQIMKDKRLLKNGNFRAVEWHFFPSGSSNTIGADPRIIEALQSTVDGLPGITYYIHLP